MLFMVTLSYEPQNRDEIVKRRAEKGALIPEGVKTIGEWTSIGGGKVFRLVETEDPSAMMQGGHGMGRFGKNCSPRCNGFRDFDDYRIAEYGKVYLHQFQFLN